MNCGVCVCVWVCGCVSINNVLSPFCCIMQPLWSKDCQLLFQGCVEVKMWHISKQGFYLFDCCKMCLFDAVYLLFSMWFHLENVWNEVKSLYQTCDFINKYSKWLLEMKSLCGCYHAVMEANLWSVFCCVFQLGHPRGLHHHTPSACCQGETVYREHRGAGTGGQRTGQGNTSVYFVFTNTEILLSQHSHENTVVRIHIQSVSQAFFLSRIQLKCFVTVWHYDFNKFISHSLQYTVIRMWFKHNLLIIFCKLNTRSIAHTKMQL